MVRELGACLQALHNAVITAAVPLADFAMNLHGSSWCEDRLRFFYPILFLCFRFFPQT